MYLEIPGLLVVANQIVFVENGRGCMDEVAAVALQVRIFCKFVVRNTVE